MGTAEFTVAGHVDLQLCPAARAGLFIFWRPLNSSSSNECPIFRKCPLPLLASTDNLFRFRIDGVLHLVHEFPIMLMSAITSRLKSLGRMDVTDKRRPQDGRVKTKTHAGNEVEMRLSTMPTTFGEKLVLRIFDPEMLMKDFTALGFSKHERAIWQKMVENPHGIILVTGPTGSGTTTTLYPGLKQIARTELNICTIEDPIELIEPQFNQMQV